MKKKLLFLSILLAGMPSVGAAQEFALKPYKVKDGVLNVYLNVEGFSPFISISDTEVLLIESFTDINQHPKSYARVNYVGRTTLPCDDLSDDVVVYCFKGKKDVPVSDGVVQTTSYDGFVTDAWVYFNREANFSRDSLKWLDLHETLHIFGLAHFNGAKSIMGQTDASYSWVLTDYDLAALAYLYPLDETSKVSLSGEGVMELPYLWVGDTMYRATFRLNKAGKFEVSRAELAIQENPVNQKALKVQNDTGIIHIPYVYYDSLVPSERGMYFVNLKYLPDPYPNAALEGNPPFTFEIVSYGPSAP